MNDLAIFQNAASALDKGHPIALVTVISTTGSTPGKVGYKMLVGQEERIVGTVGGGFVEARLIDQVRGMLPELQAQLCRFELGETPDDEKGICGGSVEFLIETFDKASAPLFKDLARAMDAGVLVSILSADGRSCKLYVRNPEQIETIRRQWSPEIASAAREALASDDAAIKVRSGTMVAFVERLAAPPSVILFGAGHLAEHIARFARSVGFRVTVCDDRPEYANRERFPEADAIVVDDFSRALDAMRIYERTYLVIVTRGHKHDEIVLERAIRTEARYIGMIGSRRKTLTLFQRLRDRGVEAERIERVYSPVGLDIGAVTPEEIALSIVCELVKVRRLGDASAVGHLTLSRCKEGT